MFIKNRIALVMLSAVALTGAAHAEWKIQLPDGSSGYNFGNLIISGLNTVTHQTVYSDQNGFGFVSGEGLVLGGGQWPDPLGGTFVYGNNKEIEFRAKVPNGTYQVWLCAGKLLRADLQNRHYLLKLNGTVLCDETLFISRIVVWFDGGGRPQRGPGSRINPGTRERP